eukprot:INCI17642.1.p1 GENE.INCI17642.1~~INCI17642.1.p1  ORF type:complete len:2187 (+),score=310.65 INCI17642.1:219-6779(+)
MTVEHSILQAAWCEFPEDGYFSPSRSGRALVILQEAGHLAIYTLNGKVTHIAAPTGITAMFALPGSNGILLQSGHVSSLSQTVGHTGRVDALDQMFMDSPQSNHRACFVLDHPLAELIPVQYTRQSSQHEGSTRVRGGVTAPPRSPAPFELPPEFLSTDRVLSVLNIAPPVSFHRQHEAPYPVPGDAVCVVVSHDARSRVHRLYQLTMSTSRNRAAARVVLQLVWTLDEFSDPRPAQRAFLVWSRDTDSIAIQAPKPFLVFVLSHQSNVRVMRVSMMKRASGTLRNLELVAELRAIDAVPLCRGNAVDAVGSTSIAQNAAATSMLVLEHHGNDAEPMVALFSGPAFVCHLDVPRVACSSLGKPLFACCLLDPVGSALTLGLSSSLPLHDTQNDGPAGLTFVRMRVTFEPHHALTRRVLRVCRTFLPSTLFARMQQAIFRCIHTGGSNSEHTSTASPEWLALLEFFDDHITAAAGCAQSKGAVTTPADQWHALLASPFHTKFCRQDELDLNRFSPPQTTTPVFSTIERALPPQADAKAFVQKIPCIFVGLHLLYEDSKLVSYFSAHLPLLIELQLRLVERWVPSEDEAPFSTDTVLPIAYRDYYLRDAVPSLLHPPFAASSDVVSDCKLLTKCTGSTSTVPSFHEFLQMAMRGRHSDDPALVELTRSAFWGLNFQFLAETCTREEFDAASRNLPPIPTSVLAVDGDSFANSANSSAVKDTVCNSVMALREFSQPCGLLASLCCIFHILFASDSAARKRSSPHEISSGPLGLPVARSSWIAVELLVSLGITRDFLRLLPVGVAQPVWELLEHHRASADSATFATDDLEAQLLSGGNIASANKVSRAREALRLIGREDLAALWHPIFNRSAQLAGASPPPPPPASTARAGTVEGSDHGTASKRRDRLSSASFSGPSGASSSAATASVTRRSITQSPAASASAAARAAAAAAAAAASSTSLASPPSFVSFIRGHHLWQQRQHADSMSQGAAMEAASSTTDGTVGKDGAPDRFKPGCIVLSREVEMRYPPDSDGLLVVQEASRLRFREDRRMKEVCRLLRSSKCAQLRVDGIVESSDAEFERAKMRLLLQLCKRYLAMPLGRGMLTFGGALFSVVAGKFPLPPLIMMARVPPNNARLSLDVTNLPDDFAMWAEFHNGAAAGFRLGPAHLRQSQVRGVPQVSRNWILFNCNPLAPTNASAGFLLALGLQGHLRQLKQVDSVAYLQRRHALTTVAVVLGRAAGMRGTCDENEYLVMQLHLPSLFPATAAGDIFPSLMVQTAALLGLALVYQESGDRLMIEYLLSQIGHSPLKTAENGQPTTAVHSDSWRVEGYSLAAGLGLGLVALGRGGRTSARGLEDLHIEERLYRFMSSDSTLQSRSEAGIGAGVGGSASGSVGFGAGSGGAGGGSGAGAAWGAPAAMDAVHDPFAMDGYGGSINFESGLAGPLSSTISNIGIGPGGRRGTGGASSDSSAVTSAGNADGVGSAPGQGSDLPPSRKVNVSITAPGAILGLGLMYIRSGNEVVASRLSVPKTLFMLDYVRPDLLMLRVVARSLVLWDKVRPDLEWVAGHVPHPVVDAYNYLCQRPIYDLSEATEEQKRQHERYSRTEHVDWNNVREARANIVSGACMALGLKYAGTAHSGACAVLLHYLREFRDYRRPGAKARRPKQSTLGRCIGVLASALTMVMAGTGDLTVLRELRELRTKGSKTTYGHHMSLHIAVGLLFLGGGKFSLNAQSNEAIAALVVSFFPVYPLHTKDGRYHLQAFRHLYVLAVEYRCLQFCDADTGDDIVVPIKVRVEIPPEEGGIAGDVKEVAMTAPCLLPPLRWIKSISVNSTRYWPLRLSLDSQSGERNARIVTNLWLPVALKRRCGFLSYERDPNGAHSLHQRPFSTHGAARYQAVATMLGLEDGGANNFGQAFHSDSAAAEVAAEYGYDESLMAFARYFCNPGQEKWAKQQRKIIAGGTKRRLDSLEVSHLPFRPETLASTLHDCLLHDKEPMLAVALGLQLDAWRLGKSLRGRGATLFEHSLTSTNLNLLRSFYGADMPSTPHTTAMDSGKRPRHENLLRNGFLQQILASLRAKWADWTATHTSAAGQSPLVQYLTSLSVSSVTKHGAGIGCYLRASQVPHLAALLATDRPKAPEGRQQSILQHLHDVARGEGGKTAALATLVLLARTVFREAPAVWAELLREVQTW